MGIFLQGLNLWSWRFSQEECNLRSCNVCRWCIDSVLWSAQIQNAAIRWAVSSKGLFAHRSTASRTAWSVASCHVGIMEKRDSSFIFCNPRDGFGERSHILCISMRTLSFGICDKSRVRQRSCSSFDMWKENRDANCATRKARKGSCTNVLGSVARSVLFLIGLKWRNRLRLMVLRCMKDSSPA